MYKQGMSVITRPVKMLKQIKVAHKLKEVRYKKSRHEKLQGGNKSKPIITCKDKKLNFYHGQTYSASKAVPLASQSWSGTKSRGDHFIIHPHGVNPALETIGESKTFEDIGLIDSICDQFRKIGIQMPTNIQAMAIPHILEGSNTVVSAETGNGKTYAFLAPIIQAIYKEKQMMDESGSPLFNSPRALIVVPGRELVTQTLEMARALGSDLGLHIHSLIGGRTKRLMRTSRAITPDIVVASFGALSKFTTTGLYKIDLVRHLVLDEADTLLDDSFGDDVKYYLSRFAIRGTPNNEDNASATDDLAGCQLTLTGATFPTNLNSLLHDIVEVESLVKVSTPFLHRILPHITQNFYKIRSPDRVEKILQLAKSNYKKRIPTIIFSNDSGTSCWMSLFLNDNGVPCVALNAGLPRYIRKEQFRAFQEEEYSVLSATDLCSRGLNTVRAQHIINYDFPKFMADYIHRCGRTGRVGATNNCQVTNFIRRFDFDLVNKIEYSVRKHDHLPNVDANIKKIYNEKFEERETARNLAAEKKLK